MRRAHATDHDAAVARRLELLTAELATVRGERVTPDTGVRLHAVGGPEADDWSAEAGEPVRLEMPGRHASRRAADAGEWRRHLPEPLAGRVGLGPGSVAVVLVLLVLGLLVTGWWVLRSRSREVAVPVAVHSPRQALATPSTADGAGRAGTTPGVVPVSGSEAGGSGSRVVVDVTGRVRRPGIAVLHSGARVVDALHAAGGARPGVDLSGLNLAQVVTDGEQIVVGRPAAPAVGLPSGAGSSTAPVSGPVDLNTADETTLESLPEVGPVTAQAIITWRTEHGGFTDVSQLLDVDGIGDATLAQLTPYVTV